MQSVFFVVDAGASAFAALPMLQEISATDLVASEGGEDFSIVSLIMRAGPVVKAVMAILIIMSLWSWTIAFDKMLGVGAAKKKARIFEKAFWSGQPLDDLDDRIGDRPSDALARVFSAGSREWRDARRLRELSKDQADAMMERARTQMNVAAARESTQMEKGLSTLAIIGSSAPFVGLFGTVWGIMNAFLNIAEQQDTSLGTVAGPIAEALFATGLGLVAAIPAVIFYNKFTGDLTKLGDQLDTFSQDVLVRLSRRASESARD